MIEWHRSRSTSKATRSRKRKTQNFTATRILFRTDRLDTVCSFPPFTLHANVPWLGALFTRGMHIVWCVLARVYCRVAADTRMPYMSDSAVISWFRWHGSQEISKMLLLLCRFSPLTAHTHTIYLGVIILSCACVTFSVD
jgi:hypothetical protein